MEVTFVIDDLNNELNWCSPALQIESLRHHLYVFYYVKYKIIGTNIHIELCMHEYYSVHPLLLSRKVFDDCLRSRMPKNRGNLAHCLLEESISGSSVSIQSPFHDY